MRLPNATPDIDAPFKSSIPVSLALSAINSSYISTPFSLPAFRKTKERRNTNDQKPNGYVPYEHYARGDNGLVSLSHGLASGESVASPPVRLPNTHSRLPTPSRMSSFSFSIPPLLPPPWCQSLLSSIRSPRRCCTPYDALAARGDPISQSDHPREPAHPPAPPPPSLVVDAVTAARVSVMTWTVVTAGVPPLPLAVDRGAAVKAVVVTDVEASAVSAAAAAPVENLPPFIFLSFQNRRTLQRLWLLALRWRGRLRRRWRLGQRRWRRDRWERQLSQR